jgi:hypothetical protein
MGRATFPEQWTLGLLFSLMNPDTQIPALPYLALVILAVTGQNSYPSQLLHHSSRTICASHCWLLQDVMPSIHNSQVMETAKMPQH